MRIAPAMRVSAGRAAVLGTATVALVACGASAASAAASEPWDHHHSSRHFSERRNNLGHHHSHSYMHKRIEIWKGHDNDSDHDRGACEEFNHESGGWDGDDFEGGNCHDGIGGGFHGAGVHDHAVSHSAAAATPDAAPASAPATAPAAAPAPAPAPAAD